MTFHGLSRLAAQEWDDRLTSPDTCCVTCGITPARLDAWVNHGAPRQLGKSRYLELGHLVPGKNEYGFVPMCRACNGALGNRPLNEANGRATLRIVTRWWRGSEIPRLMFWMHYDVDHRGYGFGGKESMNKGKEARNERLRP